jgi:hypothetical protein
VTDEQFDQVIAILKSIDQHLDRIESSTSERSGIKKDTSNAVELLKDIRNLSV